MNKKIGSKQESHLAEEEKTKEPEINSWRCSEYCHRSQENNLRSVKYF